MQNIPKSWKIQNKLQEQDMLVPEAEVQSHLTCTAPARQLGQLEN